MESAWIFDYYAGSFVVFFLSKIRRSLFLTDSVKRRVMFFQSMSLCMHVCLFFPCSGYPCKRYIFFYLKDKKSFFCYLKSYYLFFSEYLNKKERKTESEVQF